MKRITFIITTILIIVFVSSSTYAWLTYVQRKSLASLETHEISVILHADQTTVINQIILDDLAFIDYEKDLINNETNSLDLMASTWIIKLETSEDSPLTKNHLIFEQDAPGLIYILIYLGFNGENEGSEQTLHDLISSVIDGTTTKEAQLLAIENYNQSVLDAIDTLVFFPGDYVELQIAAWGDYDDLVDQANYLEASFNISLVVQSINSKGEVAS